MIARVPPYLELDSLACRQGEKIIIRVDHKEADDERFRDAPKGIQTIKIGPIVIWVPNCLLNTRMYGLLTMYSDSTRVGYFRGKTDDQLIEEFEVLNRRWQAQRNSKGGE